jgi:methylenetetrahydrofolate reductase (NADPH)
MSVRVGTRLEKILEAGHFVVTVEVGPPMGSNPDVIRKKAAILHGVADAYNVTDNQTAVVRMSSIAGAKILLEEGLEPIMQMTVRDRNRIALQSDLLGAWAMGLRNCLCISGDHQKAGAVGKLKGHPGSKNVYDIDSIQMISVLKGLKDDGILESGDKVDEPVPFFIGAAWTPFAPPEDFRIIRLAKKVDAGADFIQTQAVYDVQRFKAEMQKADEIGITKKTAILAGIIVPKSAGMLRYMNNNVPGVEVPEELINRMKSSADKKFEAVRVTVELIQAMKEIPGIKGVHLQAIEAEEMLPEIIEEAGLIPRPEV